MVYAAFVTIAFFISIAVIVLTSNTCQQISTRNATDVQDVQVSSTNIQLDILSEVESTGTEVSKQGCQEKHHPPTFIFGLHLMEVITLILLSCHCLAHSTTLATWAHGCYLKRRQDAIDQRQKMEAEGKGRIEIEVEKRLKEKREATRQDRTPNIKLENMG